MNRTWQRILAILGVAAIVALAGFAWEFSSRPTVLGIAVGPAGFDDAELAASLARALANGGSRVRLSIEPTSGPLESLAQFKKRQAQLAIVPNEGDLPDHARSVVVLHSDPVVILAPKPTKIADFHDLAGKTIGLVGPPGACDALMGRLRKHYQGKFASIPIGPSAAEISAAIRAKQIDALLFVAPASRGAAISQTWAQVRKSTGKALEFIPIGDAAAIARAAPIYEEGELASGAFGSAPHTDAESVTTLLVSTYLVADQNVGAEAITELARFIFESRQRFIADAPVAALIKAASTDKDAVISVHKGAEVYYDGAEQTLMEQYGDWLYAGPVAFGALCSLVLGMRRWLGFSKREEATLLTSVPETIGKIRAAKSIEELDRIGDSIDKAVERISIDAHDGKLKQSVIGANSLVIRHIDRLLNEKRSALQGNQREPDLPPPD